MALRRSTLMRCGNTGATDFDRLLIAIKQSDTEGRIRFPELASEVYLPSFSPA